VFNRVGVDGRVGDGGGPLVMHLVDVLVEKLLVQQPVRVKEEDLSAEYNCVLLSNSRPCYTRWLRACVGTL
jgi:hypothetical protein